MSELDDLVVVAKSWLDGASIPYDEVYVSTHCTAECGEFPRVCVRVNGIATCCSMKQLAEAIQRHVERKAEP